MIGVLLGATVATVVFLYWLKPPPQRVVVPSTMLWDRLLKEKKRNTLLDRLRWWISLMIALTIGLSVAAGIGRPELSFLGRDVRNITVVIDNSATMATRTADGFTRWQHAVAHAGQVLRQGSASGRFLILDTSGQAPPGGSPATGGRPWKCSPGSRCPSAANPSSLIYPRASPRSFSFRTAFRWTTRRRRPR
ncbi:MAG: VWA domain-containing protein [Gemmatimonadetes bacterium]|nr:VWA domain-containing protein [Gemmatimonadota bacterium]